MARLVDGNWLIQRIGDEVILFEEGTEEEIGRFNPSSPNESAKFQKIIYDSDKLTDEEKAFAHFWSGYFYAFASKF